MDIDHVIHEAENIADDFPGGASALARAIGENPTSFIHALRGTGTAKLGLRTAVRMSIRSRDPRILNAFAAACGRLPPPPMPELLDVEGDEVMRQVASTMKEFSDVVKEVSARIGDGVSDNDLEVIRREWGEMVRAGQSLMALLDAINKQERERHERAARPS